jgi:hypothetical protein
MTLPRYKAVWITLPGIVLMGIAGLLFLPVYSFLSLNQTSASADVLVVEGWVGEEVLDRAKEEFFRSDYTLLITTGIWQNTGYLIGSAGKVIFDVSGDLEESADSSYTITFLMRGTPVRGEFAHVTLYADSSAIGDCFTTRRKHNFTYKFRKARPPDHITIVFDNDTYTRKQDRNLLVYSIIVNDRPFPVNSPRVSYTYSRKGVEQVRQLNTSNATAAADYLKASGIPDSLVVPVETLRKVKSRTFTTAIDVKEWLDKNRSGSYKSLTILTQDPHARRSYISFRKAFSDSLDMGVISLPARDFSKDNWYKSAMGWKTILYELTGVLYATLIL